MSTKPIRVQLPGGDIYAPAMQQAASKTGARSGVGKRTAKALTDLVAAAVAVLNSGGSSMITLEMRVHEDSIAAKLVGKACDSPTKRSMKQLDALAKKKARSFETKQATSALTISFEV